jgi:hypothetical protein
MHMPQNPELPYPIQEHLDTPSSPVERIYEELRTGGHGSRLRENLFVGLGAIYGKSQLVGSFKTYANVLARARKYSSSVHEDQAEEKKPYRTQAFYTGSLLATHTMIQMLETGERQRVLQWWYGDDNAVQDLLEETERGMQFAATVLNAADGYADLFEAQPEELQDALMTAATQTFDDLPATPRAEYESEFMFGYVFSANAIKVIYEEICEYQEEEIGWGNIALP